MDYLSKITNKNISSVQMGTNTHKKYNNNHTPRRPHPAYNQRQNTLLHKIYMDWYAKHDTMYHEHKRTC